MVTDSKDNSSDLTSPAKNKFSGTVGTWNASPKQLIFQGGDVHKLILEMLEKASYF